MPTSVQLEFHRPGERSHTTSDQKGAVRVTAEIESNESDRIVGPEAASVMAGTYVKVGAALFAIGLVLSVLASFQLVLPDLLSESAFTTFGRLAPAARTLMMAGWLPLAGLGLAFYVVSSVTERPLKRTGLAVAAIVLIALGSLAGAGALIAGLSSGISGQEAPLWARAISAAGFLLAASALASSAKQRADQLGAAGWYLTASAWWLAAVGAFGLVPLTSGVAGSIQAAFVASGHSRLFVFMMAVGLLYFAISRITGTDLTAPRPLAALGFWSLGVTWAFMGGVELIYSAAPNWYETLTIAFAIAAFVPVLAIVTDLGLILKGHVRDIADKTTLRYAMAGGAALIGATLVNLLLAWRATSVVVQYSTWTIGLDVLIVLGGGSFAIFAANNVRLGGGSRGSRIHQSLSMIGLIGSTAALLAGGIVTGYAWIAGPASQEYGNFGPAYKVSTVMIAPFLWISVVFLTAFAIGQIMYLLSIDRAADNPQPSKEPTFDYNLEFEGLDRYVTWKRLVWGTALIWIAALVMSAGLPIVDAQKADASIAADTFRSYPAGSVEEIGRNLYISEGCAECHSQSVRPVVTDVGLGPVSIAADYVHEDPALITGIRIGPDLMHVAGRDGFDSAMAAAHLASPRSIRSWSTMPSYAYLSSADIDALVKYIETLR